MVVVRVKISFSLDIPGGKTSGGANLGRLLPLPAACQEANKVCGCGPSVGTGYIRTCSTAGSYKGKKVQ